MCGRTNKIYYLVVGQCSEGSARGSAYREAAQVSAGHHEDAAIVYRGDIVCCVGDEQVGWMPRASCGVCGGAYKAVEHM